MANLIREKIKELSYTDLETITTQQISNTSYGSERGQTDTKSDTVDPSAIGGDYRDLPDGYYRSSKFIGSFVGVILMAWSLYVGYVLPANTLSIINADIGKLRYFFSPTELIGIF